MRLKRVLSLVAVVGLSCALFPRPGFGKAIHMPAFTVRTSEATRSWLPKLVPCDLDQTFGAVPEALVDLETRHASATALAADEFNSDGAIDVVCAYRLGQDGVLALCLGTPARSLHPAAPLFRSDVVLTVLPTIPDLLVTGDFDNDGDRDVVSAAVGSHAFVFVPGDGRGRFGACEVVPVPGAISALAAGDVNRSDGLADLLVAVTEPARSRLLVFEGADGALRATAEAIPLDRPAKAIGIGHLVGTEFADIAVGLDDAVVVVAGRDRQTIVGDMAADRLGNAETLKFGVQGLLASVGVGDYSGDHREDVAILDANGSIHILEQTDAGTLNERGVVWNGGSRGTSVEPHLTTGRLSEQGSATAVLVDRENRELRIVEGDNTAEIAVGGVPVDAKPLRLNGDAFDDLVVLCDGVCVPSVLVTAPQATFLVTTTADSGPGSLRQAILNANASIGLDQIVFGIAADAQRISPSSPLPEVTDAVVIDATTQPGFVGVPLIEIYGMRPDEDGIAISSGMSVVRGLSFSHFRADADFNRGNALFLNAEGGNRVEGNYFGVNVGVVDNPENSVAIRMLQSPNNTVGGPDAGQGNLISNNGLGVYILFDSSDTTVQGNTFGFEPSLSIPYPNGTSVLIENVPRNILGGVQAGEGNVCVGSFSYGFDMISINAAENRVQGNWIGTDRAGMPDLGNRIGVGICGGAANGASANMIGGVATGAGNIIANNRFGVEIGTAPDVDAIRNQVLCNTIQGSSEIAIDLGSDEFSLNDLDDTDVGPNEQQNSPELASVVLDGDDAVITGTLHSQANAPFRIEVYSGTGFTNAGFGNGGTYVGAATISTDNSGTATFGARVPAAALVGDSIVATATSGDGNTSEFSLSIALVLGWLEPDQTAGDNPPPRMPSLRIATPDDRRPSSPPDSITPSRRAFKGYNIYRGDRPDFQPTPGTLIQGLVPSVSSTAFALTSGSFFKITACYTTGESVPTQAVGGGQPFTINTAAFKGGKVVLNGSGFSPPVLVLLDGIPFVQNAKVKKANSRVVQRGNLLSGETVSQHLGSLGVVTVVVRNPDGGTALARIRR